MLFRSQPESSRLLQRVRSRTADEQMPPDGERLTDEEVRLLTTWVQRGLPWPQGASATQVSQHWSWQPINRAILPPALPAAEASLAGNEIDLFVLSKLSAAGISPSPPANRETLIRRASLDLTGLLPTPEQVRQFVEDPAPDAWARVVDQLLASPHFGERWGRHWLDLARYAD